MSDMTAEALEALKANGFLTISEQAKGAMNALAALSPEGLAAGIAYIDEKIDAAPSTEVRAAMELDRLRLDYLVRICELRDEYSDKGAAKVEALQAIVGNGMPPGPPFGRPGGRRAG